MSEQAASSLSAQSLPHLLPECPNARLALFAMRRIGANGLDDARAAHAMITMFGEGFRRPLTLLRVFMSDLAAGAGQPIAIAPCCCARMTSAEDALLAGLSRAETRPRSAHILFADLLGIRQPDRVLADAAAVAIAFADEGRPISR